MIHEITLSVPQMDEKTGNSKLVLEKYYTQDCLILAECEQKGLELYNGNCTAIGIKESKLREFINKRESDEQEIYVAKLESIFVDDDGNESTTTYAVAGFCSSMQDATQKFLEYMKMGMEDLKLISLKRTKFIDIL